MIPRFAELPSSLRARAVAERFGDVPVLLAHPSAGWSAEGGPMPTPSPTVLWMHGRTVNKELDPGRYLRWIRAGIAVCAIDLPGHGERFEPGRQGSDATLEVVAQMADEIDGVVQSLASDRFRRAFDPLRLGIGGMSAGGMAALVRLTRPHPFRCATVECTAGDFSAMTRIEAFRTRGGRDPEASFAGRLNPVDHLDSWRPIPFQAFHSEADEWVPVEAIRSFVHSLAARYSAAGADPALVTLKTWPTTGAPAEHAGLGRHSIEAKDEQVAFLKRWLNM